MTPARGMSYSLEYRQELVRRVQRGESVRGIATRYDKLSRNFFSFALLAASMILLA